MPAGSLKQNFSDLADAFKDGIPRLASDVGGFYSNVKEDERKELKKAKKQLLADLSKEISILTTRQKVLRSQRKEGKSVLSGDIGPFDSQNTKDNTQEIQEINSEILRLNNLQEVISHTEASQLPKILSQVEQEPISIETPPPATIKDILTSMSQEVISSPQMDMFAELPLEEQYEILRSRQELSPEEHKAIQKEIRVQKQQSRQDGYNEKTGLDKWVSRGKDFVKNIPVGAVDLVEGPIGIAANLSPEGSLKDYLGAKRQSLRDVRDLQKEELGIESPESLSSSLGRGVAPVAAIPMGGGVGGVLSSGAALGALESGLHDADTPIEGLKDLGINVGIGGGLAAVGHGAGRMLTKHLGKGRTKKLLTDIKKDARVTGKEEIKRAAKLMGEEATIGEIVGSDKAIKKIAKDASGKNQRRLEKIEGSMRAGAKRASGNLPNGEKFSSIKI